MGGELDRGAFVFEGGNGFGEMGVGGGDDTVGVRHHETELVHVLETQAGF